MAHEGNFVTDTGLTIDDAIAFFCNQGEIEGVQLRYRFDPFWLGYYAMKDGWKHDVGQPEHPTPLLDIAADAFTAADWERFSDALVTRFRAGLVAGLPFAMRDREDE